MDTRATASPGCTFGSAGAGVGQEANHRAFSRCRQWPFLTVWVEQRPAEAVGRANVRGRGGETRKETHVRAQPLEETQHGRTTLAKAVTQIIRKATSKKTTKTLMMLPEFVWVSASEASGITGMLRAGPGSLRLANTLATFKGKREKQAKAESSESAAHF